MGYTINNVNDETRFQLYKAKQKETRDQVAGLYRAMPCGANQL